MVPLGMMEKLIDAGLSAPTGGNRQYWKFIAVTELSDEDGQEGLADDAGGRAPPPVVRDILPGLL